MIKYVLPLVLSLLLTSQGVAQEPTIDVQHYTFHLTLSDDSNSISGMADARVKFTTPGVLSFSLDLIGAGPDRGTNGMLVNSVKENGVMVQFSHKKRQGSHHTRYTRK